MRVKKKETMILRRVCTVVTITVCAITALINLSFKLNYMVDAAEDEEKKIASAKTNNILSESELYILSPKGEVKKIIHLDTKEEIVFTNKELIKKQLYTANTDSEIELLERLVEAEAGIESFKGKEAVARVVINRVNSEKYPNNISDVINQFEQFSPVMNGKIDTVKVSEDTKKAISNVMNKKDTAFANLKNPEKIYFFYNPNLIKKSWIQTQDFAIRIGNHDFYYVKKDS
ncbi:MAG: cell wall hydrolase [Candidatus Woesearchaeota archaeon]